MSAAHTSPVFAPSPSQARVLAEYDVGDPAGIAVAPLGDGLINETFLVHAGERRLVLQRVSPIFGRAVHEDIEAVTSHLAAKGLVTPRLLRTRGGELSVELQPTGEESRSTGPGAVSAAAPTSQIWRLMSFIPGQCYPRMTAQLAAPAGELVGRFHLAVADLQHSFRFSRPGAHVLQAHLGKLAAAVTAAQQPGFVPPESEVPAAFFPFAEALLRYGETLTLSDAVAASLPRRNCHGDLKISNLRFDEAGAGVCLLDLDTLGLLPLPFELGDALRSWCNTSPHGEDSVEAHFDLGLFESALRGYAGASAGLLSIAERDSLVAGLERIAFQLAVRFAVDVVAQNYFRFRPEPRHPTRAAHNLLRAQGQFSLVQSVAAQRQAACAIVARLFST